MPTPTPMKAATSGAPAATTEPKVASRTTAAIPTPMSSVGPSPISALSPMVPPSWMVRSGSPASVAATSSSRASDRVAALSVCPEVMLPTEVSAWIWIRTWAPSSETVEAVAGVLPEASEPKGWETRATPSRSEADWTKPSTASRWFSMSPSSAVMRTCAEVPAAWGRRWARMSRPVMDSVPEMVKVLLSLPPVSTTAPPSMRMMRSQAASTRTACSAHQRPNLYRSADTRDPFTCRDDEAETSSIQERTRYTSV